MWIISCGVVACLALHLAGAAPKTYTLPKEMKTCKRGDDVCLKDAIFGSIPTLVKGIPNLGVRPLDPLRVTELALAQGGSGPVNLKLTLRDQDVTGIRDVQVTEARSSLDDKNYMITVSVQIPQLTLTGNYIADGKILILPILGSGKNNITLSNFTGYAVATGHVVQRAGVDYVHLDEVRGSFDASHVRIGLENLFNGDRTLGATTLALLNEQWKVVLDGLRPSVVDGLITVFLDIARNIYSKVPYESIHPKA